MYFPYLRGRQFELIAIRDLVEKSLLSENVIPVVEPVKLSSALIKTIEAFSKHNRQVGIVYNPRVGKIETDLKDEKNEDVISKYNKLLERDNVLPFIHVDKNFSRICYTAEGKGIHKQNISPICTSQDAIPYFESVYTTEFPKFNFMRDLSVLRRRMPNHRVLFEDRFQKKSRNVDYITMEDEPFSMDHLYYQQDGYVGFSDYSIVGDEYSESGFAPYAVAIHIVYFDKDNSLRVRHFVSDSNEDYNDPAGKFSEALGKLVAWNKEQKLTTHGIQTFELMYRNGTYPGLGTVKKLSIMHHLELIGIFLDGGGYK